MVAELPHECCDSSNLGLKAAQDVDGLSDPSSPKIFPYDIEEADVQSSDSSLERWAKLIDHFCSRNPAACITRQPAATPFSTSNVSEAISTALEMRIPCALLLKVVPQRLINTARAHDLSSYNRCPSLK